jgi:hypothetical protein
MWQPYYNYYGDAYGGGNSDNYGGCIGDPNDDSNDDICHDHFNRNGDAHGDCSDIMVIVIISVIDICDIYGDYHDYNCSGDHHGNSGDMPSRKIVLVMSLLFATV